MENPTNETQQEGVISPYPKIVEKDGTTYELQTFAEDSKYGGFYFYIKSYKNEDEVKAQLTKVKPDLDVSTLITSLVNNRIATLIRTKVQTGVLPDDIDARAKLLGDAGHYLAFSVEEAERYVPGVSEPYSLSGIDKRIKELVALKEEEKKKPEPSMEVIKAINLEGNALFKKREELASRLADTFKE